MQNQIKKLEGIELKIRQLVEKLKLLKQENVELHDKNILLTKENKSLKKNIEGSNSEPSQPGVSKDQNLGDLFEKQEVRTEIDGYIAEIDKCIEILKLN